LLVPACSILRADGCGLILINVAFRPLTYRLNPPSS
jgi:hypothetical protein